MLVSTTLHSPSKLRLLQPSLPPSLPRSVLFFFQAEGPVAVDALLTRVFSLATHPDKNRRLGGLMAFNQLCRPLREETSLLDRCDSGSDGDSGHDHNCDSDSDHGCICFFFAGSLADQVVTGFLPAARLWLAPFRVLSPPQMVARRRS